MSSLGSMVKLFRSNDNVGLGEKLNQGLHHIVGEAYLFLLLNEFENCQFPWRQELLAATIFDSVGATRYNELAIDFPLLKKTSS